MRRAIASLAALALAMVVGPAPAADALGAGVCAITGTLTFAPSTEASDRGTWQIIDGGILCRGPFNADEMMDERPGPFGGSGSYRPSPAGESGCLRELGSGTVDYWIFTAKQDVHVREPYEFFLATGIFTTPTLRGVFLVPMHEGNCLSAPANKATFLAEVSMFRISPAHYIPQESMNRPVSRARSRSLDG